MALAAHARNLEFQQSWIDRVLADRRLSPRGRHLAFTLRHIADEDQLVVASLVRLANLTGLRTLNAVHAARGELERAGYICVLRSGARRINGMRLIGGDV